jgi:hypothetical protein
VKEVGSHSANATPIRAERTGFKINQKIIILSLLALGVCGTSYYWLDDRSIVYEPLWLSASAMWYATIAFAIIMVRNKTRLGYVIAGVLSWVTMSLWLFDNFYVAFDASIISTEPNLAMTVRNFVGVLVAATGVFASHNLFHKIFDYQRRGMPI